MDNLQKESDAPTIPNNVGASIEGGVIPSKPSVKEINPVVQEMINDSNLLDNERRRIESEIENTRNNVFKMTTDRGVEVQKDYLDALYKQLKTVDEKISKLLGKN